MSDRAEFEKSINSRFPGMDLSFDATGEYADLDACQHWETWQAARSGASEAWLLRKQAEAVVPAIMRALTDMGNADLTYSGARIYAEEYAQRLHQQADEIEKSGANQ